MGTRRAILTSWLVITLSHLVGLRLHNPWLFLVNTLLIFVGLRLLFVYLEVYLHDHISSERRATIVSLASTLGYGIFFVLAVGFALLQKKLGVVAAITWVSLPLLSLGLIDMVIGLPWAMKRKTSSYS
jgi:hypothetical protein